MAETIEGTVNISVSQLDKLRDEKKAAEVKVAEFEANQGKILVVLKVVEDVKSFNSAYGRYGNWNDQFRYERKTVAEKVEFQNLSELQKSFEEDARLTVHLELETANKARDNAESELLRVKDEHNRSRTALIDSQSKETAKKGDHYRETLQKLLDKITVLEGNEVEKKKDQRIVELSMKLLAEQNKSWWDKLLGR